MDDARTITAENRSFQWELMMQYDDGSLPASAWHEATLLMVAQWYAKNVPGELGRARFETHFDKNRRRLTHRLEGATVNTEAIEAVDAARERIVERAFGGG